MQYLLNYSLTGQIQKYFSLTNPADVQAAACLLIFDLLRFKCTVSQRIHFYFILLFATYHHHHWWLMTKRRNHSISTFPPLALFCMLGLCHTFARPVPLAVPGCHNQLETQWASFRKVYFEARNANTDSQLVENHITLLNPENLAQHECHKTQRSDEIYNSEFHCRGGKKKKSIIKWGFADRKRRDWLANCLKLRNTDYWGNAMDWNQTPRKKYSSMFCNWMSPLLPHSLQPFKWAYALRIRNTLVLWEAHLWKVLQIRHQKSPVII